MPQVIGAIAISALAGAGSVAFGVATVGQAVLSVAVTAATSALAYVMKPSVKATGSQTTASPNAAPANTDRSIIVNQPVPPRQFMLGNCRIGGKLFFQDNDNPYLYIGVALSDGVIAGIDAVYFGEDSIPLDENGEAVEGTPYFERFKLETANGTPDQAASALLLEGFPNTLDANFRQRGVARGVVRMHWGADAQENRVLWGNSVSPVFQGRGVLAYDPREESHDLDDPTTWEYTENPALLVAFVLLKAWGIALSADDIDWDSVADAADACDETVSVGDSDLPIFTLAGIFAADTDMGSQISGMLSAFRGKITYQDGKYALVPDRARASVWTVRDADILEIGEYTHATESRALFNAISASFFDSATGGRRTTTAPYELAAAITAEGLRETTIDLPFTALDHSAQIIAYRELMQLRDGRACAIRLTDAALYLSPADRITIASAEAPFLNGDYEVLQVDLADVGALVTLRGYNPDVYTNPSEYLV